MKLSAACAFVICFATSNAQSQQGATIDVVSTRISTAAGVAVEKWASESADLQPTLAIRAGVIAPGGFCDRLKQPALAVIVAPLSAYRECYPAERTLAALDVPLMTSDPAQARRVLIGPLGAAVGEGLNRSGLVALALLEGEARVISSSRTIQAATDLKGRRILTDRPSESMSALFQSLGGTSVPTAAENIANAANSGLSDTAEVSLSNYARDLAKTQRAVLLSNHSLDPIVIAVVKSSFATLKPHQAGALESATRQLSRMITLTLQTTQAATLSSLQRDGVQVSRLTALSAESFKSPAYRQKMFDTSLMRLEGLESGIRSAAVSQVGGQSQSPYWKVFFVTNRVRRDGEFRAEFNQELLYGSAEVEMIYDDPASYMDEMKGLVRFVQGGRGLIMGAATPNPFPAGIFDARRAFPARAPVLYVHGFANSFDDAIKRAAWIGWNARRPVLVFSWPSKGLPTPSAYKEDLVSSDMSVTALAGLLRILGRNYVSETDIDVMAHSMGNKLLVDAMRQLANDPAQPRPIKFRQLLLIAADVSSAKLEGNLGQLGKFFDLPPTLYVSDHDLALGISRSAMNPADGNRAGLAPPVLVKKGMESIFVGPNDFSFIGHSYLEHNGVIADDMMELLRYGTRAGVRRGNIKSPMGYFELKRLK